VFVGGCIGGGLRYAAVTAWPTAAAAFPWSTLLVNLIGAFVLAGLLVYVEATKPHHYLRPLLGSGLCGGFTTFGSVAVGADQLVSHGHTGLAASYLAATVAGGVAAAAAGFSMARLRWHVHPQTVDVDADVEDE
jgi:CrcB protein